MKNETGGKAITKSAATKPKPQRYKVQKIDDYKIENSEFIKAKRVKYSVSKELIFNDFDKPTRDITNTLITTTENEL